MLREKRMKEMLGRNLLMVSVEREALGRLDGLLGLERETV